jgi:hypothetical protein
MRPTDQTGHKNKMKNRFNYLRYVLPAVVLGLLSSSAFAVDADIDAAVNTALTGGVTSVKAYLLAGLAIPIAFLVWKLGKRVMGKV